jgi:hypothetical protein
VVLAALLPRLSTLVAMTRPLHPTHADTLAYHGEVWTDARGYATVELPTDVVPLAPPFEYELRDVDPPSTARISAALESGRFTVATDEPHVKVAWRITGHRPAGQPPIRRQEEASP